MKEKKNEKKRMKIEVLGEYLYSISNYFSAYLICLNIMLLHHLNRVSIRKIFKTYENTQRKELIETTKRVLLSIFLVLCAKFLVEVRKRFCCV